MYSDQYQWNSPYLDKGYLVVCHEQYSIPHIVVFCKLTVKVTSRIIEMGYAKRNWGDVEHIKYVNHLHISTENTEKKLMIYTKARL